MRWAPPIVVGGLVPLDPQSGELSPWPTTGGTRHLRHAPRNPHVRSPAIRTMQRSGRIESRRLCEGAPYDSASRLRAGPVGGSRGPFPKARSSHDQTRAGCPRRGRCPSFCPSLELPMSRSNPQNLLAAPDFRGFLGLRAGLYPSPKPKVESSNLSCPASQAPYG